MRIALVALFALSTFCSSLPGAEKRDRSPIGKQIGDFSLRDYRGKVHHLHDVKKNKLVVIAVLGVECPLAKLYAPRLEKLAKEFAEQGVAFYGIDSNQQDSTTEIAAFARVHHVKFPILKDAGNVLADELGAVRTPEVFVLDAQRKIRYWGRIDDQYGFTTERKNYQLPEPKQRELATAITELLAGKEVSHPVTESHGCHIGRIRHPNAQSDVTYTKQIVRILNDNCVYCHREGQIAPFTLTAYDDVVGWAEMIREVTEENRMPPWHADPHVGTFSNDARLNAEEKALIDRWVENGAPEGDSSDLPEPPTFAEGWQIPEPDEVIYMREEPFQVPAEGVVEYQHFVVDPGWEEDKWISSIEARPGNAAIVHHILVFVRSPRNFKKTGPGQLNTEWIAAFAPGTRQGQLPEGMARFVPKGSQLIFQMHYTPNGSEQLDRSYLGIVFADPEKVKKEVAVASAGNYSFRIPPEDSDHRVEATYTFRRDSLLMTMMPHMHLRGKDYRYEAIYPDGRKETLLSVPNYDFGWQTIYSLAEPKAMPAGTKLHCVAHFDNSADNLNNPDPSATITFGEQTWDEMMIGFFEIALTDQDLIEGRLNAVSRVDEFQTLFSSNGLDFDETLKSACKTSLKSDEFFERFGIHLSENALPQIDRICATYVDDGKLRLYRIVERPGYKASFRSKSTRIKAPGQALAEYIGGDKTVVNDDITTAAGSIMRRMARRGIRSSMHVPIEVDGIRGTINFWSLDENAFPAEAVKVVEKAVGLMTEGKK